MENQTSFDLNRAISRWRDELGQSNMDRESLDELAVHMVDSIAALQASGLSAEEAFVVGKMRIGTPAEIESEFSKIHSRGRWKSRFLWSAVAIQFCLTLSNNAVEAASLFSIAFFWNHPPIFLVLVIPGGFYFWKYRKWLAGVILKPWRVSTALVLYLISSNVWFSFYLWRHARSIAQHLGSPESDSEIVKEMLGVSPTARVLAASILCVVLIGFWTRYEVRAARRLS